MFKSYTTILEPDSRYREVSLCSPDGTIKPYSLADHHEQVSQIALQDGVPVSIRDLFDVARNTFVYSWFSYELATPAELFTFSTLEGAIRSRVLEGAKDDRAREKIQRMGLAELLGVARSRKLIVHEDFQLPSVYHEGPPQNKLDILIRLRNELAHGEWRLLPQLSLQVLTLCAEVLNCLYRSQSSPTS